MSVIKPSIKKNFVSEFLNNSLRGLSKSEIQDLINKNFLNEDIAFKYLGLKRPEPQYNSNQNPNLNQNGWEVVINSANERTANDANQAANRAVESLVSDGIEETKKDKKTKKKEIEEMQINENDLPGNYRRFGHFGDSDGRSDKGKDLTDFGADSLMSEAKKRGVSSEDLSLHDRLELAEKSLKGNGDKLRGGANGYYDGQGIADLGSFAGTGLNNLNDREWFELVRTVGDQYIGLARAETNSSSENKSEIYTKARNLLINKAQEYTNAGFKDGNLIGVLIGKGISANEFKSNDEEKDRYKRYLDAKNGSYNWRAMTTELKEKGINKALVEDFTGISKGNHSLFTENLFFESYANVDKLSKDLHYFKDKALGFNLIFTCGKEQDHNGALHMNQGSLTGLGSNDKNPTLIMHPKNETDMMRMIFRLSFIPKKPENSTEAISGANWLKKEFSPEERSLMKMLKNNNLSSKEKIEQFNKYLTDHGLEKNVGVANYMLKGHGFREGIALFDKGNFDNSDKGLMALMGLSISAHVDQARVHQQSCSTAKGGRGSNAEHGNDIMNDFAPYTTKVVTVGAGQIHWNGTGERYQHGKYVQGSWVNDGYITDKKFFERNGLNTQLREEEIESLKKWTKTASALGKKKHN